MKIQVFRYNQDLYKKTLQSNPMIMKLKFIRYNPGFYILRTYHVNLCHSVDENNREDRDRQSEKEGSR